MLPSCKEVAELASENIDEPVKGIRWLKMKFHLLICAYCRRYGKQIDLSKRTVSSMSDTVTPDDSIREKIETCYRDEMCNKTKK